MGIFSQFYLHSGLQIVEGIEEPWTLDGNFFFFPPVNSFVTQDGNISRHHLTPMCSRISFE